MSPRHPFTASGLAFAAYWSDPTLRRDLDVLVRCGRVQEMAVRKGEDSPASWFWLASRTYPACDDQGRLARRACELVADAFRAGRPS